MEPNPFERSFATKDNSAELEDSAKDGSNSSNKHNLHIPINNLPAPLKLPGITPPLLTPGGRRLPPLGLSPGSHMNMAATPGGTLWNSLLSATNSTNENNDLTNGNVANSHSHLMPQNAGGYFAPYLGSKKTGLTPSESNTRTGLTPGGAGPGFHFGNQIGSTGLTPNGMMTPGLSSLLGLSVQNANTDSHNHQIPNGGQTSVQAQAQAQPHAHSIVQAQAQAQAAQYQAQAAQARAQAQAARAAQLQAQTQGQNQNQSDNQNQNQNHSEDQNKDIKQPEEKTKSPTNNKRKAAASVSTGTAEENTSNKKPKSGRGRKAKVKEEPEQIDDEDSPDSKDDKLKDLTEEEKRQHFLERNRLAASKCRQRKKQKVAKMEDELKFYSNGYRTLTNQMNTIREQIIGIRNVFNNHKSCPMLVSQLGSYNEVNRLLDQMNYLTSLTDKMNNNQQNMDYSAPPPAQTSGMVHGLPMGGEQVNTSVPTSTGSMPNGYDTLPNSNNISAHQSMTDLPTAAANSANTAGVMGSNRSSVPPNSVNIQQNVDQNNNMNADPSNRNTHTHNDVRSFNSMTDLSSLNHNHVPVNPQTNFNIRPVNSMVDLHHMGQHNNMVDMVNSNL